MDQEIPTSQMPIKPFLNKKSLNNFTINDVNVSDKQPPELLTKAFENLVSWINKGKFFKISSFNIQVTNEYDCFHKDNSVWRISLKLATNTNIYHIAVSMREHDAKSLSDLYLGATSSSRRNRAGETWARGSDLSDGKFSEELWNKILSDIVSYELVTFQSDAWKK